VGCRGLGGVGITCRCERRQVVHHYCHYECRRIGCNGRISPARRHCSIRTPLSGNTACHNRRRAARRLHKLFACPTLHANRGRARAVGRGGRILSGHREILRAGHRGRIRTVMKTVVGSFYSEAPAHAFPQPASEAYWKAIVVLASLAKLTEVLCGTFHASY
jgi:hypothetical protein